MSCTVHLHRPHAVTFGLTRCRGRRAKARRKRTEAKAKKAVGTEEDRERERRREREWMGEEERVESYPRRSSGLKETINVPRTMANEWSIVRAVREASVPAEPRSLLHLERKRERERVRSLRSLNSPLCVHKGA